MRTSDFSDAQLSSLVEFDYLIAINRSQGFHNQAIRSRFELFPLQLRQRLPKSGLPLVAPDPEVVLDLQDALNRVYEDGSYMLKIRYDQPCFPSLTSDEQAWVKGCWNTYRAQHADLFA